MLSSSGCGYMHCEYVIGLNAESGVGGRTLFRSDHSWCTGQIGLPPSVGSLCACLSHDVLGGVALLMLEIAGLISSSGYILKEEVSLAIPKETRANNAFKM